VSTAFIRYPVNEGARLTTYKYDSLQDTPA
jgi:hypothetical protein